MVNRRRVLGDAWVDKSIAKSNAFNSEFQDLLTALEETSGRDLVAWANTWLQTAGVNTLAAEFTLDDDGSYASFAVRQAATAQFPTLRPHRIGIGLYDFLDGRLIRRAAVETDVDGESTDDSHKGEIELESFSFGGQNAAIVFKAI